MWDDYEREQRLQTWIIVIPLVLILLSIIYLSSFQGRIKKKWLRILLRDFAIVLILASILFLYFVKEMALLILVPLAFIILSIFHLAVFSKKIKKKWPRIISKMLVILLIGLCLLIMLFFAMGVFMKPTIAY
jgi:hypothetical protein